MLTSLLEAADRVDSTTGLQMAFLKSWAPRSYNELELRLPEPVAGPAGTVTRLDANELAPLLEVDLVYVDPPYNQHSFFSNYHVWETLVRWDAPESYGVANKRLDCRERKSRYNSKRGAPAALAELLGSLRAPWLLVSASDEGFHGAAELRRAARRARPRRPSRDRLQTLRRCPDRDLQPLGREGRNRLAAQEPRVPVPGRARQRARRVGRRREHECGQPGRRGQREEGGRWGADRGRPRASPPPATAATQGPRPRR